MCVWRNKPRAVFYVGGMIDWSSYIVHQVALQGWRIISHNVGSQNPSARNIFPASWPSYLFSLRYRLCSVLFRIGFPMVVDERPHTSHSGPFLNPRQLHLPIRVIADLHRAAFPPSRRPQPQHPFRKRMPTPAQPGRVGHLLSLSARGAVLMAGDEEGAEGCGGRHGEGDVGRDVLPVGLPDGVEGGIAGVGADAGDADDGADDGEDGEAEGGG